MKIRFKKKKKNRMKGILITEITFKYKNAYLCSNYPLKTQAHLQSKQAQSTSIFSKPS